MHSHHQSFKVPDGAGEWKESTEGVLSLQVFPPAPDNWLSRLGRMGPIVEAQQHPGGTRLRTSDTAIDPLQCSNPGPFSL